MDYYLKIKNDKIVKIYNTSYEVRDNILGKPHPKDGKFIAEGNVNLFTKIIFAKERQNIANSKSNYLLDGDKWRLKTDAEIWTESGRAKKINELKQVRNKKMSETVVELNGKTFWADPGSEQNFSGRIREMEIKGLTSTKWIQGEDIFEVTLDELKQVVTEGTKLNAAHWDEYINAVEALPE